MMLPIVKQISRTDQQSAATDPRDRPETDGAATGRLRICEVYASIQGEGLLTGMPSVLIRTSGCNLRCWFCDTPFASWNPEGDYYCPEEIVEQCLQFGLDHVVVTGGEPMLYPAITELTGRLHRAGFHITIETAGTIWREVQCNLMSVSPKLASSAPRSGPPAWKAAHDARRERLDIVRRMMQRFEYQLKFVVDTPVDAEEVLHYLQRIGHVDRERVLVMPQGTSVEHLEEQAKWLLPWCREHGVRFCPRAHIAWFGNRRGT